ncbi:MULTISPECIES: uracil-xanthine permease family protein [Anaerotruncus]|jgi:xanthine permease|uniref:uracil-xanthine permease family protein n=1 Tax=Anaerotruncus TaxID=244127 RepID=UPI00082B960A|nr:MULTISPECIES: nucleobase:cation symporter-2 family protein [Anaerotruncus]RGX55258.1 purine permease [Anaerotruncus sp. AF02-27]
MKEIDSKKTGSVFEMSGVPAAKEVVPLGLQHVVAAIVGVVTPAIILSGVLGISAADKTLLIQVSLLITAIATLVQVFGLGPVGARLPVVMGVSFAYVPTLLALGNEYHDIRVILGAQIIGGAVAIIFGIFVKQLRVFFPPMVTGTVIFTIGLSLYPTAVKYMAGGAGSETFGSWQNWLVAIITLAVVIFCNYFTKGVTKLASILMGIIVGYIVALCMGMVDFTSVGAAGIVSVPVPMHFGLKFVPAACVSMAVMYIVNSVQTIGDLTSTTIGGLDREPTDQELQRGIICQGSASIFGAFFGGLPTASYSQNVGIVTVNRVVNRVVFGFAAIILLIAGFVPKFSALLTTIPQCVIGGATISVFAQITMTGIRMISSVKLTPRNTAVVGISVALGVGVTQSAGSLAGFPGWVGTVFGGSSVVIATLAAILLNLILPKDPVEAIKK